MLVQTLPVSCTQIAADIVGDVAVIDVASYSWFVAVFIDALKSVSCPPRGADIATEFSSGEQAATSAAARALRSVAASVQSTHHDLTGCSDWSQAGSKLAAAFVYSCKEQALIAASASASLSVGVDFVGAAFMSVSNSTIFTPFHSFPHWLGVCLRVLKAQAWFIAQASVSEFHGFKLCLQRTALVFGCEVTASSASSLTATCNSILWSSSALQYYPLKLDNLAQSFNHWYDKAQDVRGQFEACCGPSTATDQSVKLPSDFVIHDKSSATFNSVSCNSHYTTAWLQFVVPIVVLIVDAATIAAVDTVPDAAMSAAFKSEVLDTAAFKFTSNCKSSNGFARAVFRAVSNVTISVFIEAAFMSSSNSTISPASALCLQIALDFSCDSAVHSSKLCLQKTALSFRCEVAANSASSLTAITNCRRQHLTDDAAVQNNIVVTTIVKENICYGPLSTHADTTDVLQPSFQFPQVECSNARSTDATDAVPLDDAAEYAASKADIVDATKAVSFIAVDATASKAVPDASDDAASFMAVTDANDDAVSLMAKPGLLDNVLNFSTLRAQKCMSPKMHCEPKHVCDSTGKSTF